MALFFASGGKTSPGKFNFSAADSNRLSETLQSPGKEKKQPALTKIRYPKIGTMNTEFFLV